MSRLAVVFDSLTKVYPLYSHLTGGSKYMLLHPGKALLSFRRSRFQALTGISFTVEAGESFGIIGRNGAGKSTILALMAGVIEPTYGRVSVYGRVSPFLELGAGFHPDLTGRDNIMLNGVLMGLTRAEVLREIDGIIAFSELGAFIDQPLRVYSSGMLSRLGFSVVAHLNPDILLVDEEFAVGDIGFERKCIDKMQEFKERGVTIVLVSHDMDDIISVCSRTLWIDDRRVRMLGDTERVVSAYMASWDDAESKKTRGGATCGLASTGST
jgi:lipopolysaccharide transport system ATP-binding protein